MPHRQGHMGDLYGNMLAMTCTGNGCFPGLDVFNQSTDVQLALRHRFDGRISPVHVLDAAPSPLVCMGILGQLALCPAALPLLCLPFGHRKHVFHLHTQVRTVDN